MTLRDKPTPSDEETVCALAEAWTLTPYQVAALRDVIASAREDERLQMGSFASDQPPTPQTPEQVKWWEAGFLAGGDEMRAENRKLRADLRMTDGVEKLGGKEG